MSRKYKFKKLEAAYFVSFATVNWVDVFPVTGKGIEGAEIWLQRSIADLPGGQ